MQTVETFSNTNLSTPFPLDDPYTAYNNINLNVDQQQLHLYRMYKQKIQGCSVYNSEQLTNYLIVALDGKLDHPLNLYFSNVVEYRQKYIVLAEFMKGLVFDCDDQLFHKFICYFQSPRRLCAYDGNCVALGNLLTRIRNTYRKTLETDLNSREKLEWINDVLDECSLLTAGKKPNTSKKTFKFSENLEFSISNMVFCNEHYHVLGFQCDDCFSHTSLKQLFYTFPAMIAMQLKQQSKIINKDYYTCFTFDNKRMLLHTINLTIGGDYDNVLLDTTTTEISLENKFSLRAFVIILLQCQSKYPNCNICNSAIKNANFQRQEKVLSMKSYYDYLFKRLSSSKLPNVSEIHKKNVKERSLSILKDITNIQHNISVNKVSPKPLK